jgi:hypothetical protein
MVSILLDHGAHADTHNDFDATPCTRLPWMDLRGQLSFCFRRDSTGVSHCFSAMERMSRQRTAGIIRRCPDAGICSCSSGVDHPGEILLVDEDAALGGGPWR